MPRGRRPRCGSGHPHYIGTYAADAPYPRGQADLVMQVGARDWGGTAIPTASRLPQGATFVAIGLDTAMLGRTRPLDLAVVGDVKAAMRDLIDAIKSMATADRLVRIREGRAATVRAAWSSPRLVPGRSRRGIRITSWLRNEADSSEARYLLIW